MRFFNNRPFVAPALLFAAGVGLGAYLKWPTLMILGAAVAFFALTLLFRKWEALFRVGLLLFFLAAGFFCCRTAFLPFELDRSYLDGSVREFSGIVAELPVENDDGSVRLTLKDVRVRVKGEWLSDPKRCTITLYGRDDGPVGLSPVYGQTLRGWARLNPIEEPTNPGAYNYKNYWAYKNVASTGWTTDSLVTLGSTDSGTDPYGWILGLKEELGRSIEGYLGRSDGAALLTSVLLGDRSDLPDEVSDNFQIMGVSHLLAISGLHVGILAMALTTFLRRLKLSYKWRLPILVIFLSIYSLMTGLSPSIVRASLMMIFYLVGEALGQRADRITGLALSMLIILIISPLALFQAGFQLSYAAVAGILLLSQRFTEGPLRRLPGALREITAVNLSAQLATLPLMAWYFGRISILSFFVNLIIVPIFGVFIVVGLVATVLGLITPYLAAPFGWFLHFGFEGIIGLTRLTASVPYTTLILARPSALTSVGFGAFILFVSAPFFVRPGSRKVLLTLCCVVMAAGLIVQTAERSRPEIVFLDVGQGDSVFVRTREGAYLIDGGGDLEETWDPGKSVILPFLRQEGALHLKGMVISHPDADHVGGLLTVLQNTKVDAIYCSKGLEGLGDAPYHRLLAEAERRGIPVLEVGAGDELGPFQVLGPAADMEGDANDRSMVLSLELDGLRFLTAGDLEADGEEKLQNVIGEADLIKVSHHGSATSTTEGWLDVAEPAAAVISVGRNNLYRHPNSDVLERLTDRNIEIFRTDLDGAVILFKENELWKMTGYASGRAFNMAR
jgi:competence protein ComEC